MSHRPLAALAAALLLAGCAPAVTPTATPSAPTSTTPMVSTASASPSESATPTQTPAGTRALVYFMVDTSRGPRLVREPRIVDRATPARGALEAMIAGPVDPDYASPLPKETRVVGINHRDHLITVELSAEAQGANVGSAFEAALVQQIIWTVTEALEPTASVLVTIGGQPASWGHLQWDEPLKRGEPMDTRLLVGIDSLADGATVTSPLRVAGEANVFEATLLWRVLRADGSVAANGYTSTTEGQVFAPWELTLTLPTGAYTLEVSETDPSGGEGSRTPDVDTRAFTIG